jgi:uncharacterized glyoxalase superfamily metalloenzyme YdcJ
LAGRDKYDSLTAEVDRRLAAAPGSSRQDVAARVWSEGMPGTELDLLRKGLAFFTFTASRPVDAGRQSIVGLVEDGAVVATPIVYEDFLPRSAAGIFQSNLAGDGRKDPAADATRRDAGWLSDVLGREVADPMALYAAQQQASVATLGIHPATSRLAASSISGSESSTSPAAAPSGT